MRVALPSILRSQIEKQAGAAIMGHLTVGDVDLWLLLGGVALKDVAFQAESTAPSDPPLVAFKRMYVQVGYLPFFHHTVRIRDFTLDGAAVHLERLASGEVPLPGPRAVTPAAGTTPPPPTLAASAGTPWNVVVDQAALRDGHFSLRDRVSDPPETAELALDAIGLKNFILRHDANGAPGHGSIEAGFGDGTVRIDTTVTTRAEGFAIAATVDIANLPLDRTQLHAPQLGWSGLSGRLDAHVTLTAEPGALPVSGGTVTVRALRIEVPGENEPALEWRSLSVDLDDIGIEQRRAVVKRVALDGGGVIVTPRGPAPLPLLAALAGKKPPAALAKAADDAGTVEKHAPPPVAPRPAPSPAAPWTWKVGTVEITDTRATVVLEPPPLVLEIVKGTVTGLESAPGSRAQLDLQVREEQGTVGLVGSVGLDPLGATLTAKIDGLGLARLLAATGAAPVQLSGGTLAADLKIEAEHEPLIVGGTLAVADLEVRLPQGGEEFGAGWKRLEIGVKEVRVPGVLPVVAPATPEPVRVDLEHIHMVAPTVALTRTPEGLVLPASGAPASAAAATAQAEPPKEARALAKAASPGMTLALARLDLENGQVSIVDRAVKPFYRGKLSAMTLTATGLRFPENLFDTVAFTATLPGGAPFKLEGKQSKGIITLSADGKALPLQQFNPYVTQAAGYSVSGGTLTVGSKVRVDAKGYDSKTRIELDKLGVTGAEGDSLFLQTVGIPLSLALNLLRDTSGKIGLDVPVSGSSGGTQVALGSIVSQALVKAIVGAVMSPLKMLGSVADLATGKEGSLAPEPIPCGAGLPGVDAGATARVEQLGGVLAGAPGLRITLHGAAGGTDVRVLQEAAVFADLQAKQGVLGGIRNLASRTERNAIRDSLAARATGTTATLAPEYEKTLDEWASAKTISDDQLRTLAAARAETLKAALVQGQGIDAARITLGDPRVDRDRGMPAVMIALGG